MNARLESSAANRHSNITTILAVLLALAPAAIAQAQEDPTGGAGGRRGVRGDSPATRPASGLAGGRLGGPRTPVLGEGPTCSFDATIYDVRIAIEQIGRLDVAALAGASDTDAFEKALAALGTAKPIYRADQSVRLSGDTISISSQTPYVSDVMLRPQGRSVDTVSYMSTGAIFSLAGKANASDRIDMDLNIHLSSRSDSGISISDTGDKLQPIIHTSILQHKGPIQPGKPFVVFAVDAGSPEKDGKAVAYIVRVTVGDLQPSSAR